jgi:hypothetical protein
MIENIVVLLLVAAAAVYTVVRLCRVAAGRNKCVCGSNSCSPTSMPCCGGNKSGQTNADLPILPSACDQRGCGCG